MSFQFENLPKPVVKRIIEILVDDIKTNKDIQKLFEFIQLSKTMYDFIDETIEEIYNFCIEDARYCIIDRETAIKNDLYMTDIIKIWLYGYGYYNRPDWML
jgi:hypothetical protein